MLPSPHSIRHSARVLAGALLLAPAQPLAAQGSLDSVQALVRREMSRQRIPGLSLAIVRGDSIVLARGYGLANVELNVPASDSTIYQSGSVGKQFTAALVALLAEEGKLRLDDPIARHLSGGPASWRTITVRHLLTHTSGIPDYTSGTVDYRRDYTEDELVRFAASLTPTFAPGTRWSYSNTGYVLLGAIVRKVTGQFYGDLLEDRIFEPAGMRTARVISEEDIVPNRAAGYRLEKGVLKNQAWVSPALNTTADGALYMTVRDLARWTIALDGDRLLPRRVKEQIWTPVALEGTGGFPYGFGWRIDEQRGFRRIGHGGSWQGFKATIQRYPDFGLTVIAMANVSSALPDGIATAVAGVIEPALRPPHALAGRTEAEMASIVGQLRAAAAGDSMKLTPAFRRYLDASARADLQRALDRTTGWQALGCDEMSRAAVERFGVAVMRACYASGRRGASSAVVAVLTDASGRIAAIEQYSY